MPARIHLAAARLIRSFGRTVADGLVLKWRFPVLMIQVSLSNWIPAGAGLLWTRDIHLWGIAMLHGY
jgi:hypothetical protein